MKVAIFNPEHDLCLGNGRAHYMPPQSAVDMARQNAGIMSTLYPDATCSSAYDLPILNRRSATDSGANSQPSTEGRRPTVEPTLNSQLSIIPWGWDAVVRQQLLDSGCPVSALPDSAWIDRLRMLQHRSTLLPLQPQSHWLHTVDEVMAMLRTTPRMVLKAPWSGSGRGIRWIAGDLSEQDRFWVHRMVERQNGIIAEPWLDVRTELALEYMIRPRGHTTALYFKGLSLFESRNGVYRGNWFLDDNAILQRTGISPTDWTKTRTTVERWLRNTIAPHYQGPLGVDLLVESDGQIHVSELNLRHTMGMVAHALLRSHPGWSGCFGSPLELHHVVLSLGSNMGNRAALLRQALRDLSLEVGPVTQQSTVMETDPWGFQSDRNFLNQVVVVETALPAEEVLHRALGIEQRLGRRRDYDPLHPPASHAYQSRPIDIDLIFYDKETIDTPLLQLPHPRMHLRRFVLEPLCELMPDFEHPTLKKTMKELLNQLD